MYRLIRASLALAFIAGVLGLAGCSSSANSEGDGAMKVWGYVAAEKNATLETAEAQTGADSLEVDRVLSPGPAWLVVHLDDNGKPGDRVGLLHVDKGESAGLEVALDGVTTDKVIVALHADKGTPDQFDFDMMNKEASPDRPYFVDGKEVARVVVLER